MLSVEMHDRHLSTLVLRSGPECQQLNWRGRSVSQNAEKGKRSGILKSRGMERQAQGLNPPKQKTLMSLIVQN